MNILAVVAHTLGYGDACAALSIKGRIVGIIEEERFSRLRYDDRFPGEAINYLFELGEIAGSEIDLVVLHLHPFRGIGNRLYWLARSPWQTLLNSRDYLEYYRRYGSLKRRLQQHLGSSSFKIEYYGHHLCHAAAAFYTSSFERAAILTLDGAGEGMTGSIGIADRKKGIKILRGFLYPHSLGMAYSAICDYIGFPAPAGPGKVMALAAYGDTERFLPLMRKMILVKKGRPYLDLSHFVFYKNLVTPLSGKPWMSDKFSRVTSLKRRPQSEPLTQSHMDLAAALQARINEVGVELAKLAAELTNENNLCLGGGVALNCVMNGAIFDSGLFKSVHVQPAAGDAGNSLGAIYLASVKYGENMPRFESIPYGGTEYSDDEIESALKKYNLPYRIAKDVAQEAARAIKDGLIVGWFQGRMEFGPRALGCRSILADPQRLQMKEILNQRVKHREWFRPFAPSVTRESCGRYFSGPTESPYMLITGMVRQEWRNVFPSITHVDGSARIQTVSKEINPLFYALLKHLEDIHGHPVVLNTSFNMKEPIVCTPEDAIRCFINTQIDILCIGNFVVRKVKDDVTV